MLSPTSSLLHPQQGDNWDSNSLLVVDEDDNGKFRLDSVSNVFLLDMKMMKQIAFVTIMLMIQIQRM